MGRAARFPSIQVVTMHRLRRLLIPDRDAYIKFRGARNLYLSSSIGGPNEPVELNNKLTLLSSVS